MELNEGFQLKKQKNVEIQEPWAPTTPEKTTTTIIQKNKSPCELACQYGSSGLGSLPGLLASSGQATSGSIVMLHTPATTSNNSSLMGPLSPQVFGNKNGAYSVSGLNKVLMRIGNGLEMPTKSNILVFNAKSFLIASPSNSSYSSNQPDRLPVTSLPNLNSVPKCPVGVSMAVITPAPSTPAIIENCSLNMKDNQIPLEVTNFAQLGSEEENLTCKELMSSQLSLKKLAKKVIVFGSKFVEVENSSTKRENDGIDWNETPTKKPRRKKHRPKVIIDGKPSRILRDGTPLPETPEQGNLEERRSYKSTYVRRKKDAPASSSLNALVKNDVNRTSARRCLKFDSAEKCTLNECSTEMTMFEVAEARARVLCNDRTAASSSMKETVHSCELYEKVMENSVVPIVTDLSTAYQSENECHKMFSAPIMSTEVNKSFGTSEKQMTSLKFSRKKLKELAREKACTDSVGFNVVSFSEAAQNSLNSSSISNPKHKGTIRDQHVTGKHQNSAETSFKHSYNLQGCLQKTHNATKLDSILPVKRKRTKLKKMSHSEATSEFSPKCGRIAKGWKLLRLSDTVLKFTFTDAQSFMTKDTMLASEKMLSFKYKPELHGNHAIGSNSLTYSTKPSMQNNMGFLQPSTPKTLPNFSKYLENRDVNEAHLMVSNISDGHEKAKKRDRKKQDKVHSFKVTSSRVKHECVQMLEDSCYVAGTPVQSIAEEGALASRNLCLKNSIREPISVDYQCKRCFEVVAHSSSSFGALNALMDCVDEIIQKLKSLNISSCSEFVSSNIQNILVPYVGHGCMIVPYERNFDMLGKRRPRAKVDLDPESNRVWKLLMGKDDVVGDVQADLDKGSWWSEQRRVFQGRVDSFIARMRLVQGDRRFSQWKGSVVDSVVGVFLTQNVSDHLSSSAFMALISKFPLQPRGKFSEPNEEKVVLDENVDKKGTSNCAAALLSCSGSSVVDYSQENANLDEKVVILDHESCTTAYGTIVSAIENTSLGDMKNERDLKDVFPTQNFVVSSQNFMDCNVQSNNHISANSDGLLRGNLPTACSSSSFTELLQMSKCSSFQELFIHGNGTTSQEAYLSTKNCFTALNKFGNSGGTCPSVKAYSNLHLRLFCSSTISPSKSCLCDDICNSKFRENNANLMTDKTIHCSPSTRCEIKSCNECKNCSESEGSLTELSSLHEMASSIIDFPLTKSKQHTKSITLLDMEASADLQSRKVTKDKIDDTISANKNPNTCSSLQAEDLTTLTFQNNDESRAPSARQNHDIVPPDELHSGRNQQTRDSGYVTEHKWDMNEQTGQKLNEVNNFQKILPETPNSETKNRKRVPKVEKSAYDWEDLRKKLCINKSAKGRSDITMDSLDWEAVRCADVSKIADTIRERGMNNVLAERIQEFLNRLVREHGCIDLEWLRDLPPDTAKDYLLSIRGLGLKSVECVRLLALQQLAFPVDTNVGRICVRLGWVPLQPLPESLQLHLLELYPVLESIQKYLWPRLCKLDQRTLYELHYQMITFGKVFCTKSKPNCNACPLRSECKHFASAFASARLTLPAPKDKSLVSFTAPISFEKANILNMNPRPVPCLEESSQSQECTNQNDCIPIVEEPTSPEPECYETIESAIEDAFYDDPDEIPMIKLNFEEFSQNLQDYMQENMEIQDGSLSKALVALTPEAASIPMPKLKNVSRLRTEHQVYELPDSHPLLNGVDPREPDDPSPYLLAIWTPGETAQSSEPPNACCESQNTGQLCDKTTCFACSSVREAESHKVRGTLLIPCRTAMRGSFPLNGTYFQVNEVFADHHSSCNPIDVPRDWIWNLPRRTVYFGTSIPTIFRGLTTEEIQHCFWRGFVCVRGFDRVTGAPKPLYARLHFPASKASNIRKAESVVKEAMLAEDVENSTKTQL